MAYIEEKTNEYLAALEQNDLNEKSVEKVKNIQEKIAKLSTNKIKYEQLTKAIEVTLRQALGKAENHKLAPRILMPGLYWYKGKLLR